MHLYRLVIGRQILACILIVMLASCTRANSPPSGATGASTARPPRPVATGAPASATATLAGTSNGSPTSAAVGTPTTAVSPPSPSIDRDAFVQKMLQTNGGCELPCWWGIIPGTSDATTAEQQLKSYGGPVFPMPSKGQKEYEIYVEVQPQQNGIVRALRVSGSVPGAVEGTSFAHDFRSYSLGEILTRHGRPSQVRLELSNRCFDPPCVSGYGLYLIYEHLGVLIAYYGPSQRGDPLLLCPQFTKVGYVKIALQSPDDVMSLFDTAKIPQDQIEEATRPLEEVTDMTIDQFYRVFKEHVDTKCISSAASYWPK